MIPILFLPIFDHVGNLAEFFGKGKQIGMVWDYPSLFFLLVPVAIRRSGVGQQGQKAPFF